MLVSYNWLKAYVKLPDSITPQEIADKLKLSTVEVEGVVKLAEQMENIVVGKILKVEKHPQADKLKVCEVDVGTEKLKVVCGGSNVKEKMLVAFAKLGSMVKWHGEGEPVVLEKATIRGVESSGMICGADEIGLLELFPKKEEKEIVDLTGLKLKPGTPIASALGVKDVVFEIDNKSLSNRPDLWGHYGMAREVAVLTSRSVAEYKVPALKGKQKMQLKVEVKDQEGCPRYTAVAVEGVKIEESPLWLKQRLTAAGIRPINNVVDITNYVMLDLGQPLHAFDAEKLSPKMFNDPKTGERKSIIIQVRKAEQNEKFRTLDGKEYILSPEMLLIAIPEKAVALAGVMGGEESGISSSTSTVVFESANFAAASIRKTTTKLGFRTDSSARFEKGLDPTACGKALSRAVNLLSEICPTAKVASNVEDVGKPHVFKGPIHLPENFIESRLGVKIPSKNMVSILEHLGFGIKKKSDRFEVTVPSWRANDCRIEEDIVEEVARIYGYQNISSALPNFEIAPPLSNSLRSLEREIADMLVKEFALTEIYNYSFVSENQIRNIGDDISLYEELDNPLSKEKPYLRRNLLTNLLDSLKKNSEGRANVGVFETGKVFLAEVPGLRISGKSDELLPRQDTFLEVVLFNRKSNRPFREMKQVLERASYRLDLPLKLESSAAVAPWAHPGRTAKVILGGADVGEIYELHPKVGGKIGLQGRVGIITINLSTVSERSQRASKKYEPVPMYPEVERDLAFLIGAEVSNSEIILTLGDVDPLLKKVELFDVYEGSGEKKSMAYHLTFASSERTLTSEEVEKAENKIKELLRQKWGVEFR